MRPRGRWLAGAVVAALAAGCAASLERVAPTVEAGSIEASDTLGVGMAGLRRGRDIYLDQCARCHRPYAVANYDAERWDVILPGMIERTRLAAGPAADVTAYIRSVSGGTAQAGPAPSDARGGRQ